MLALLLTTALQTAPAPPPPPAPKELWEVWKSERVITTAAPCFRHEELVESLRGLAERHPEELEVEAVGRSFEGRSIHLMTLGRGDRKVMLWSQMHGDEPSATPALLDLAAYLLAHPEDPTVDSILGELTLLMVPMLNPDGTERYQRRNAQGIDINRDALNLATPEGRLLKRLRDEHEPILGFNLHDQNRLTAVGETGELATNAVLAVAGDSEGTVTAGRLRAKRACAAIVEALAPLLPGRMARYDEDWSPRAFGDNLTAWGTPVVLIESGGMEPDEAVSDLPGINFVALLTVLGELARDDLAGYDPQVYEDLERNQRGLRVDVVVRGGEILQPGTVTPYRADLAFDLPWTDQELVHGRCARRSGHSRITEIGDARFLVGGREVDARKNLVVAPFVVGMEGFRSGRRVLLPENLEKLARLGVGEVRWAVRSSQRRENAEHIALGMGGPGLPRISVSSGLGSQPVLLLERAIDLPQEPSLAAGLRAIGAQPPISQLWKPTFGLPAFRPGERASFLVIGPWEGADTDYEEARLLSVWLDGVEIGR